MKISKKIPITSPYIIASILVMVAAGFMAYKAERTNTADKTDKTEAAKNIAPAEQNRQALAALQAGKFLSYTHPALGFTFQYPEGYAVGNFPDGEDGETVLVQQSGVGFQIYIRPFDEDTVLTAERIKRDLPGLTVQDQTPINMDNAQGVAFLSRNDAGQTTREAWLVHNRQLYQISAPQEMDETLMKILQSWRWN